MNPLIQLKTTLPLLIILAILCFTLLSKVQATPDPKFVGPLNTADGENALFSNTTGAANVAFGWYALFGNTDGNDNTAVGAGALDLNTGNENTAVGTGALALNAGGGNTAVGAGALELNSRGINNTANGAFALQFNSSGINNTANGFNALFVNTTGSDNTGEGAGALENNSTGSHNIALGSLAGSNLTTGDNNIDIGNDGVAADSNTIRIGTQGTQIATYIAGITGAPLPNGLAVVADVSTGQLGVISSSERFKKHISTMNKTSEAILALRPVTFRYKTDANNIPQFGLIAEEVAKVNPGLVVHDKRGKPYSVRYDAVNAMLLNEFLKEHNKVEKLEATVAKQHEDFEAVLADLKGQIQKVTAQLELTKPAPQTVLNNH